jgi:hypothetical protein
MVLWANHQTPRARPGLPPPCTGSIVHDFVLLVSPPCGPHLVPLSTGSFEPSLLVSPSPGGPSRLKTFHARSSPATTRTRPQHTPAHWAKSQSNTRFQSLITKERSSIDHRDAPGPHYQVSQPLDEAKMDLGNFAKNLPLMSKVLNMIKTYQNGEATQTSC